jgi:sulfatase maturation enzyme AslB (radical SAM superfamily)
VPARGRGDHSSRVVAFRDPEGLPAEIRSLKQQVGKILVNAPALPVPLPGFSLTLVDITVDRRGIDLLVGPQDPVARLRVEGPTRTTPDSALPLAPEIKVTVVPEVAEHAGRFARTLSIMAARVQAATTPERWGRAWEVAQQLRKLPVDVPLGFFRQFVAGVEPPQGLVRSGFLCNQDCGICWQGRDWGRFPPEQVITWIDDLRAAGAVALLISGGEPTLDPDLERYMRHARDVGYASITLETNAIRCARPDYAEKLRDAGVSDCFVSLHSGDAAVSDAITRAPGTFQKTVSGIQALLAAGVPVKLNCVMTAEGLDTLPALPDFIHTAFGSHRLLRGVMLSAPTESFDQALLRTILPEPTRLRMALRKTIDRAMELGIHVEGLDGPCGPPLCAFGADPRITSLRPVPEPLGFRTYLPPCEGCSVRHACFGVRTADAEMYGDACALPILQKPC